MYTSYFSNVRNVAKDHVCVGICVCPPDWWDSPNLPELSPPGDLLARHKAGKVSHAEFELEYHQRVLSKLDAKEVHERITNQFGDKVVLVCFEAPGDFCHRRILAYWMGESAGIHVPEYGVIPRPSKGFGIPNLK